MDAASINNPFLPEDYKVPKGGNYYKFADGDNTFRVLSSAIVGWEYWNEAGKPIRSKTAFKTTPEDIRRNDKGEPEKIKHFWAFLVWDYESSTLKILELTQKGVMDGIKALVDNPKWGDPKLYDITVTRSGNGLETKYQVMPNPHSNIPDEALTARDEKSIRLDALFEGGDPFEA